VTIFKGKGRPEEYVDPNFKEQCIS